MAKIPVRASTPEMGPIILVSGYLSKRTRGLGRWKKRWWQLTDDGTLLYFKSDERTKVLGEIDLARSCYDVKYGADQCKIEFPRAVPSCCCFSFSVLKRTYYLFAATTADAKRWTESIANVSAVLNYRKKGLDHRPVPDPRRPVSTPCLPREDAHKASRDLDQKRYSTIPTRPNRFPRLHASVSGDITTIPGPAADSEAADQHTELPRIIERGRGKQHRMVKVPSGSSYGNTYGSAPNLQRIPRGKHIHPTNPRLWLDGSPQPSGRMAWKRRPQQRGRSVFSSPPGSSYNGGSLDRRLRQPTLQSSGDIRAHYPGRGQAGVTRGPVDMDGYELPPRPQSVDFSILPGTTATQLAKRTPKGVPILPYLTQTTTTTGGSGVISPKVTTPPVIKPKPILKKPKPVQSPELEYGADRELEYERNLPPKLPPKHCTLKVTVQTGTGQRDVFLPPPPDFKPPPPPPDHSSGTSSPVSSSTYDRLAAISEPLLTNSNNYYDSHMAMQRNTKNTTSRYLQQV